MNDNNSCKHEKGMPCLWESEDPSEHRRACEKLQDDLSAKEKDTEKLVLSESRLPEENRVLKAELEQMKREMDQYKKESDSILIAYCNTRSFYEEELFSDGRINRVLNPRQIALTYRDEKWVNEKFPEVKE